MAAEAAASCLEQIWGTGSVEQDAEVQFGDPVGSSGNRLGADLGPVMAPWMGQWLGAETERALKELARDGSWHPSLLGT